MPWHNPESADSKLEPRLEDATVTTEKTDPKNNFNFSEQSETKLGMFIGNEARGAVPRRYTAQTTKEVATAPAGRARDAS